MVRQTWETEVVLIWMVGRVNQFERDSLLTFLNAGKKRSVLTKFCNIMLFSSFISVVHHLVCPTFFWKWMSYCDGRDKWELDTGQPKFARVCHY